MYLFSVFTHEKLAFLKYTFLRSPVWSGFRCLHFACAFSSLLCKRTGKMTTNLCFCPVALSCKRHLNWAFLPALAPKISILWNNAVHRLAMNIFNIECLWSLHCRWRDVLLKDNTRTLFLSPSLKCTQTWLVYCFLYRFTLSPTAWAGQATVHWFWWNGLI